MNKLIVVWWILNVTMGADVMDVNNPTNRHGEDHLYGNYDLDEHHHGSDLLQFSHRHFPDYGIHVAEPDLEVASKVTRGGESLEFDSVFGDRHYMSHGEVQHDHHVDSEMHAHHYAVPKHGMHEMHNEEYTMTLQKPPDERIRRRKRQRRKLRERRATQRRRKRINAYNTPITPDEAKIESELRWAYGPITNPLRPESVHPLKNHEDDVTHIILHNSKARYKRYRLGRPEATMSNAHFAAVVQPIEYKRRVRVRRTHPNNIRSHHDHTHNGKADKNDVDVKGTYLHENAHHEDFHLDSEGHESNALEPMAFEHPEHYLVDPEGRLLYHTNNELFQILDTDINPGDMQKMRDSGASNPMLEAARALAIAQQHATTPHTPELPQ